MQILNTNKTTLREKQVRALLDLGIRLIPLEHKGKDPDALLMQLRGWSKYLRVAPTPYEYDVWIHSECNFAALLGQHSSAIVFDFDHQAFIHAKTFLRQVPKTILDKLRIVRTGSGYHVYVFTDDKELLSRIRNKKLARSKLGTVVLEVKSGGGYVVVPPSIHPSGLEYQWCTLKNDKITTQSPAEFLVGVAGIDVSSLYVTEHEMATLFDIGLDLNTFDYQTSRKRPAQNPITTISRTPKEEGEGDEFTVGVPPVEYIKNEFDRRVLEFVTTGSGERNQSLFIHALFLGRVGHMIDDDVAQEYVERLSNAAVTNGMVRSSASREVTSTIRSGLQTGFNDPLNIVYTGDTPPFAF